MNFYGILAREHWENYRPRELAEIEDPEAYFRDLGAEISAEIDRRTNEAQQRSGLGTSGDFLANLAARTSTRRPIVEEVLREMVFEIEETPAR
ncbi:hypothetical protein [Amycolatopsis sp. WGS_07]|uniref:hypothetical protein n=1 Tax=Amycolatopsis sp. WGS_07 TaxID=3076764 RepID=UPI003873318F